MVRWITLAAVLVLSPLAAAADFTPKQQRQVTKSAQAILKALEDRNFPSFQRMIDSKAVLATALDRPKLPESDRKEALAAMKESLPGVIRLSVRFNQMTDIELAHVGPGDAGALIVVKGQTEGRTTYWEFHLAQGRRGKFKIVDWLALDVGLPLTDGVLLAFAQDARNTNALVAVLDTEVAAADLPALGTILGLQDDIFNGRAEFPDFLAAYTALPAYLKKERVLLRDWEFLAQVADADSEYFAALEQIEKHYGDNWQECELLLIHYGHVGDEDGAQRCSEALSTHYTGVP